MATNPWKCAAFGCALVAQLGSVAALAGPQAERALAAARKLVERGEVPPDAVIKVAFKPGNIAALLGPELELQREWERGTGVMISARVIPQQPALANLKNNPDIDITVARTHEFPDLLDQGLVEELTPYLGEFNFRIEGKPPQGYVRPRLQGAFGDKQVAIPADGDVTIFYLRRDLMESPAEKAAFKKRHGRELVPPRTWQEYEQLIAFFHRPEQGLYGAAEFRDRSGGWMLWLPRYLSQGTPHRPLFDDALKPLVDSPAGIAATESYLRALKHSPPDILGEGKDYNYVLNLFLQGKAFSTVNTIAGAKLFNSSASAVRGKFLAIPVPGQASGDRILRHNIPIFGNNLVISSKGAQRKLAFLFTMWLTDPDISLRTVGVKGGFTDPYRWHHLNDARIKELYTPEALNVFEKEWSIALPPGTGMPGDAEYLEALDLQLWKASRGEVSAAQAMRQVANDWERITQARGRERQASWHRVFSASFSGIETDR